MFFLQLYFHDQVPLPGNMRAEEAVAYALLPLLLCAAIASVFAGQVGAKEKAGQGPHFQFDVCVCFCHPGYPSVRPLIVYRLPSTVGRLPSAVCRLPSAVCRRPSAVGRRSAAAAAVAAASARLLRDAQCGRAPPSAGRAGAGPARARAASACKQTAAAHTFKGVLEPVRASL